MNAKTDRFVAALGVMVVVATLAIWKDVDVLGAVTAIVAAGLVYFGADHLLGRQIAVAEVASVPGTPPLGPSPVGAAAPPSTTEDGSVVAAGAQVSPDSNLSATLDPELLDPNSIEVGLASPASNRPAWTMRVSKHGQAIHECEDAARIDPARWVVAVADGASSSFGAGRWAQTLVDQFVAAPPQPLSPGSFDTWVERSRAAVLSEGESGDRSGWWAEEGARRGAFATIVGAAVHGKQDERVVTVMCLGDSCAFLLGGGPDNRVLRRALPYEDASQFGSHPSLIGSLDGHGSPAPSWTTMPTAPGDVLVLASDAVSEWLLADHRRFAWIEELSPEALADLLVEERSGGRIVNDDLTVAVMGLA